MRFIMLISVAASALFFNSCCSTCCTSDSEAPKLRPLPQFGQVPGGVVSDAK